MQRWIAVLIVGLGMSLAWPIAGYIALKVNPKAVTPGPSKPLSPGEEEKYWSDYNARRRRIVMRVCPIGFALFVIATLIGAFAS